MIPEDEFHSWNDYVDYMAKENTYGDQITLFAAANIFNVDITITSSLGAGTQHTFHPSTGNPFATVHLGHFAENQGEHYVSLASTSNSLQSGNGNNENIREDTPLASDDDNYDEDPYDLPENHNDESSNGSDDTLQQLLNNDVLEIILKFALAAYPFMRASLRSVNRYFQHVVDKVPFPSVYIPELEAKTVVISVRKLVSLKGKGSSAIQVIKNIVNISKWYSAWIKLAPTEYGWFSVIGVFWKNG